MAKKSRKWHHQGGNRPQQHHGGGHRGQGTNAYTTLVTADAAGELNAHLTERFAGSAYPMDNEGTSNPRMNPMPSSGANGSNDDIRKYFEAPKTAPIGGNWLQKPEMPTPAEILLDPANYRSGEQLLDIAENLRPNKIEGAYDSNEEYLGTHYDLLREDSIRPLREAVEQVRASPYLDEAEYSGGSIGIYDPVYITSVVFSHRGLATRIAFSLNRVKKHVRWDQSKRLITGTLVALSPADDCFQNKCIIATVAARPLAALDQNPPEIDLFFARAEDMEIDPMRKWVMVENRASFYEASRHTMLALQHMMQEKFPLSEHLVNAQKQVEPPEYVANNPYTNMSTLVTMEEEDSFRNVNILQEWPEQKSHGLDTSQSKALKRILTNRLAIVQGPPGTGKTYVSVVALKILLANMRKDDPPIIVTCQTNHALDQLLLHVAEFEPDFIRLGGRSKDKDKIKKRTLYEVKNSFSRPQKSCGSLKTRSIVEIKKLTGAMQLLLAPLEANKPPLDHRLLVKLGLITGEQAESLEMDSLCAMGISSDTPGIQMEQWLGKCLTPCLRPIQPDDFDMEYEEEDFEIEQLQELEAEAVAQDDDFETLRGPVTLLSDNRTGKGRSIRTDDEIKELLNSTQDLTTIPVPDRGAIYNYFQRETKRLLLVEFRKYAQKYEIAVLQRKAGQWEQDQKILSGQRLIGMTTTGLSKYRGLISSLRPKIVLVEEAAETLEAPVTAACLPSLQHLILVGDHQQLRPHCQVRGLEDDPYNFNLSLFERMVINEIEIDTLTRQRRMIPEVRRLLEPIYGNTLKDHSSVLEDSNRPPVEGMGGCNSFFFTHEWPEKHDANSSALNESEADMVVGFFNYLVLNGVDPSKITVLTFYNGQRKAIIKRIHNHADLQALPSLKVVTVDSYQGEENDIVLLSLVRSNKKHKIGFLSVDNRVCVALSRAKRGFYIFGNAEMLACESAVWAEVVEIMYGKKTSSKVPKQRHVGYHLPLECTNHHNKLWIEAADDFDLINGGCDQTCRCLLPCGHTCMLRCHPFDRAQINCTQKCNKRLELCGHPCTSLCCDSCKCQFCDRRNNGMRAMLRAPPKKSPMNGAHVGRPSQEALEAAVPTERSGSSTGEWQAYADGGARADDTEYVRKMKQDGAKFLERISTASPTTGGDSSIGYSNKLIEVSPVETQASNSKNANTLIDLDMENIDVENVERRQRVQTKETFSYAVVAGRKGKEHSVNMNLLD